jgi:phosphoribosylaminoimidazolecarboxamide formyltransferase/IMP cyclohydrolase
MCPVGDALCGRVLILFFFFWCAALRSENGVSSELRKKLALKAFRHTASYDSEIANWFTASIEGDALPQEVSLHAERIERLRYGENPHQQGSLYRWVGSNYPFEQLQGKELSYNNILDVDAAWECCMEFADPACVIIKHLTPCGIATADNIVDAYKLAYESDTVSAFGSIIAVNRGVDVPLLEAIGSLFLEVLVARSFTNEAVEWLSRKKKNCRVMRVKGETRKDVVRFLFGFWNLYGRVLTKFVVCTM